ncbi:MAG: phosphopantetheine-binding protein [Myxococcota bacterium]|nr:phosphopantetheine-binding protein [Myxococcota bacterium]
MSEIEMDDALRAHLAAREEALGRVRRMLVERLHVPLPPERIDLDAPLFGTGLGLDSVDAVELVVAIEAEFALQFSEGAVGPTAFRTVHSVVELVLDPPEGVSRVEPEGVEA